MTKTHALITRFVAIRRASGWTPSALAYAIGMAPATLLNLESGRDVKLSTLVGAAEKLGYSVMLVPTAADKHANTLESDIKIDAKLLATISEHHPLATAD